MEDSSQIPLVDDDPFMELNKTMLELPPAYHSIVYIIMEIAYFLVCTTSLGASILLILVLKSSRKLRKQHKFLLHYAIVCLLDMVFIPLFEIINDLVIDHFVRGAVLCAVFQINYLLNLAIMYFGSAIGWYWFLEVVKPAYAVKYEQYELLINIGVLFVFLAKFSVLFYECFLPEYLFLTNYLLLITYALILILIAIVNGIVWTTPLSVQQSKRKYNLRLSTIIVLNWLPLMIVWEFYAAIWGAKWWNLCLYILVKLTEFLVYGCPIFVVFFLGKHNKYFRMSYRKVFKKNVRSYEDDDLDCSSDENSTNHDDSFLYVNRPHTEEVLNGHTV